MVIAAGSFHTKKLCSRLYSIEIEFYLKNTQKSFFEPHFGGLRGNILGLHRISYPAPAPAEIRPNFHIRPYTAPAGYGRRI